MLESALSKKIARRIRDRGGWARKIPGGPHGAGLPDVIGCYRGYMLGLEVKRPGKESTVTTLQRETLNAMKTGGAIAVVITSVRHVDRILDRIDQIKDRKGAK